MSVLLPASVHLLSRVLLSFTAGVQV